jgi:hypothetical protein
MKRKSKGELMVEKASKQAKVYPSSSSSSSAEILPAQSEGFDLNLTAKTPTGTINRRLDDSYAQSLPSTGSEPEHKAMDASDRVSELISVFRCIDIIMFHLQSRGQLALWSQVEDNAQRIYSKTISIDDLCLILMVYPGAYTIDWHAVSGKSSKRRDYQLSIQLPVYQVSTSVDVSSAGLASPVTSTTTSTMSSSATKNQHHLYRMEHLSTTLDFWIKQRHSLIPDRSILPTKPNLSALDSSSTNVVKKVSRDLQSKKILAKIAQEEELSKFQDGSLAGLRNLASHREKQEKELLESQQSDEQDSLYRSRVEALSRLAYMIRALSLQQRRKYQSIDDFIKSHADELATSRDELRMRLKLLADECPEFLILEKPVDVDAEVMQINQNCPMQLIQERIASLVSSASSSSR